MLGVINSIKESWIQRLTIVLYYVGQVDLSAVKLCFVDEPGDMRVSAITKESKSIFLQAVTHLEEQCASDAKQVGFFDLSALVTCSIHS